MSIFVSLTFSSKGQSTSNTDQVVTQTSHGQNNRGGGGGRYLHRVKTGRVNKHRGGRGGFNPNGFSHAAAAQDPGREFECLFCEVYTHKTRDCNKMRRAKQARNESPAKDPSVHD